MGAIVLLGWLLHNEALKVVLPTAHFPVRVKTALATLLSGGALFLLSRKRLAKPIRLWVAAIALVVILLTILTLAEFLFGWNAGIDEWLDGRIGGATANAGQMSPITALGFALVGSALFSTAGRIQKPLQLPLVAGSGGVLVAAGAVPLFGFLLEILFGPGWNFMGMDATSITGAAVFLLLGIGLLALVKAHAQLTWSLDWLSTAGIATGFILIILSSGLFHNFALKVRLAGTQISHSQRVLSEIEETEAKMFALENQQQRYVITGDETLLGEWSSLESEVRDHVRKLQLLVALDSHQQPLIRKLSALVSARIKWARTMMETRRQKGFSTARDRVNADFGGELASKSLELIRIIQKGEHRRLEEYRAESEISSQQESQMLPLGVFLCCAILSIGLFFLNSGMGERVLAEKALRQSEEGMRAILDSALDCIVTMDQSGKVVEFNPAAVKTFGYHREEAIGQLLGNLIISPRCRERHADALARYLVTGEGPSLGQRLELSAMRRDGSEFPVELAIIRVGSLEPPLFTGFIRDITEQKAAGEKLRTQAKQFRLLFDDNPSPMWVFDVETLSFLAVNQAAIVSYGYSREEFLQLTLRDIRPAEDVPSLLEAVSKEGASSSFAGEWRHLKKDGSLITAAVYSSPTVFDGKSARVTLALNRTEQAMAERKMRDSEANLALAQKVAGIGSWEYQFTAEGRIDQLTWSQEVYRLFGLSPETPITTETFFRSVQVEDRAIFARRFRAFMKEEAPFKMDLRIVRPDGARRIVHAVAVKIFDQRANRLGKVVGTILDITERRAVEEKLREADEKYRLIFDNAVEGIFQTTPDGHFISANSAFARMLGYASPEDLICDRTDITQQSYAEPEKRQEFKRRLELTGFVNDFEFEAKRKDGSTIWMSENVRLVRTDAGEILYYEGTAQDITQRKRASKQLQESEQRLAIARQAAHMGIWDWNVVTNELVWDQRMYELYGIRAQDFSGAFTAWQKGLHPDDRVRAVEEIMAAVKGAHGFHTEFRVSWPDGQIRNLEAHAEVVRGPDGATIRMIGANWDITERKRAEEALYESEQMLRSVVDTIPHRVFWKDRKGVFLGGNRALAEDAGFAGPEEIVGMTDHDASWSEQAENYLADDREVMESGVAKLDFEEPLETADGRTIWLKTDKLPLRDRGGNVYGVLGMYEDVTARRHSEETLRLLNSAVLQANESILITEAELDLPGPRIVFTNPAFTTMSGYTAAEILGQTPRILQGPRTDRAVLARLRETLQQGGVFKGEAINYRKDGTAFDSEWQIAPIRDANEKITHFVSLQRDITARRQAEQEMARFSAIMAATTDFVGVADSNGRVIYMNSAGRKMIGFAEDEDLTKTNIADHVAPSQISRLLGEVIPAAVREGVWSGENIFVDRQGQEIPISQVIVAHLTPTGEIDFIATTAQDLTARKKADAALEEANRQLLDASRQAGMAEVATSVLHNVGNVLNSVNVSCSVISDKVRASRIGGVARTSEALQAHAGDLGAFFATDPVGRKLPDFLGKLALRLSGEQSEILGELQLLTQNIEHIKDIVAVQQSHAKDIGGIRETLPLQELVEDVLRMNAAALVRHRIEVVREYDGGAPAFPLEKHKVVQILVNLVRNAKHALADGGGENKRLVLRVARHNGTVAASVSDNGIGIAPENKIRIFSHGFTTKKNGHGFGLHSGVLAAKEMGGSLVVKSDGPGKGATFTLELPLDGQGKN